MQRHCEERFPLLRHRVPVHLMNVAFITWTTVTVTPVTGQEPDSAVGAPGHAAVGLVPARLLVVVRGLLDLRRDPVDVAPLLAAAGAEELAGIVVASAHKIVIRGSGFVLRERGIRAGQRVPKHEPRVTNHAPTGYAK